MHPMRFLPRQWEDSERVEQVPGPRRRQAAGRGGTSFLGVLDQQPALDRWSDEDVKLSHRRELFRWAADRVKETVKEATWRAFWLTAVEDRPVEDVAHTLGLSTGAVYIARSRVLARLRDEVKRWEDDNDAL